MANTVLPPNVTAAFGKVKATYGSLSKPTKVMMGTGLVLAALIAGFFGFRNVYEPYQPLFSSMDKEDAAQIIAKLKELKTPYRLTNDGSQIEVPEAKVHELRLELAGSGLPRGGSVGFESFDKMRLGATDFEQRVLYRRALEGELARTIGSIGSVQSARVHLVLPEKSVFLTKREASTASVIVKLRGGRTFGASEIGGIVHLVASSVPGLSADGVTLVTTEGQMLHRPRKGDGADGNESGLDGDVPPARALEGSLEERTRAMLERVVGPGHADVRVSADLDLARVERVEDHYDPAKTALRSEERTVEKASPPGDTLAGVPGAESNIPNAGKDGTTTTANGTTRESYTRNFEVDHVVEKRIATHGALKRLTVAVILDGVTKMVDGKSVTTQRSPEEIAQLTAIVRGAVGADDKRGDLITVHSMTFSEGDAGRADAVVAPATVWERIDPKKNWKILAGIGGGVFVLFVMFVIAMRRARARRPLIETVAPTPALLAAVERDRADLAALTSGANGAPHVLEAQLDMRAEALERAAQDPASAALVLRSWLGGVESEQTVNDAA